MVDESVLVKIPAIKVKAGDTLVRDGQVFKVKRTRKRVPGYVCIDIGNRDGFMLPEGYQVFILPRGKRGVVSSPKRAAAKSPNEKGK